MVQGIDVDLFRPDDELKKLARLAVETKVDDALMNGSVDQALAGVAARPNGKTWIDAWEAAKNPWFNFTSGNGFYSADKYWIEHLDIPLGYLRNYITQVKKGMTIERPTAAVAAERERITKEYAELLNNEARPVFEQKLGLARTVFPYVENHNFYIEHWSLGVFWRKMRELNELFIKVGFWSDPDGLFYLNPSEARQALWDYCSAWGVGGEPTGPHYWPRQIERRRKIVDALATQKPQPALNEPPEVVTEPFTIMLWGITTDRINAWLKGSSSNSKQLTGMAASPARSKGRRA